MTVPLHMDAGRDLGGASATLPSSYAGKAVTVPIQAGAGRAGKFI